MWSHRPVRLPAAALAAAGVAVLLASIGVAADSSSSPADTSGLDARSDRLGQQHAGPGALTVGHWTGQTTNPVDGNTYQYDIVGADPAAELPAEVGVDIVPVDVRLAGLAFNGSETVAALTASPIFQAADFSTTSFSSTAGGGRGAGGELSAGNAGQLLDVTMRAEFGKIGTGYHVYLDEPHVLATVALSVPAGAGLPLTSPAGITYGLVDGAWFETQVESLAAQLRGLNPTRLAMFVTKNVVLFADHNPAHCCVYGAHGVVDAPRAASQQGVENGRQRLQTLVWSSWLTAGFFNPANRWNRQDIDGFSHEITEWAHDPFNTNFVQPWFSPMAGCSNMLETADPVVGIGFSVGSNPFDQNPFTDGTYHVQDEMFLPWFMRTSPAMSQPSQGDPTVGRYSLMGDLNPIGLFHQPAVAC